jgi:serine/threonine-protein kinase
MDSQFDDVARALPDYDIDCEIGAGAFGVVWRGRHRQLQREVAVKQLSAVALAEPEYVARFRREARLLAQLDHPHVVRVYDYRETGDLRLLVMELLPGGTFADRRARGMRPESAIAATLAAARGLHHAHEHGVLHRDVKPENLMFDGRGTLKVTDFGIARDDGIDSTAVRLTRAGELFGTPAYVSPEQAAHALAADAPETGPASDQYSLAAVLYEALSGRLTHDANGGAIALCNRRTHEDARPLVEVAPDAPGAVANVVMRALRRAPAERFPSMEEFARELHDATSDALGPDWLARSDVSLRDSGPARGSTLPPAPAHAPVAPRRRRVAPLGLGALVLVALAVGGWLLTQDGSGSAGTALPQRWSFATEGGVFSSPAVEGKLVVVGSRDRSVYGIDATNGTQLWKRPTGGIVFSSPFIANGRALVGSKDGYLYSLRLADGRVGWKKPIPTKYEIISSPTVADGLVFVGADKLYAFDEDTGDVRWEHPPDQPVISSPAVGNGMVVYGSNDGFVYGVTVDGEEKWFLRTGDQVRSSPTISGGLVYVGSLDGNLYARDLLTGAPRWDRALRSPIKSSPLVAGGRVIVGTDAGDVVALDARTGDPVWSVRTGDRVESSPALVGSDLVAVGGYDHKVYVLSAATGAQVGEYTTDGPVLSSPTAIGDDIVVGSEDGHVYRLGSRP